ILRDDLVPNIRVFLEVGCHACWYVRPGFDTERFGHSRPNIAPLEHVAVRDVERLVRRLGRPRSPDHHVGHEVCIGGFPDKRRTARKSERFTLLAADGRVDTDSRENVQRAWGWPGDELRTQCRVAEAVLGPHSPHLAFLFEK